MIAVMVKFEGEMSCFGEKFLMQHVPCLDTYSMDLSKIKDLSSMQEQVFCFIVWPNAVTAVHRTLLKWLGKNSS